MSVLVRLLLVEAMIVLAGCGAKVEVNAKPKELGGDIDQRTAGEAEPDVGPLGSAGVRT